MSSSWRCRRGAEETDYVQKRCRRDKLGAEEVKTKCRRDDVGTEEVQKRRVGCRGAEEVQKS